MRGGRAVVLVSGGMDSCVCAALAMRDYDAAFLHVEYGQRTAGRERQAYDAMVEHFGVRDSLVVSTAFFRQIGGSALTDASIAVPEGGLDDSHIPMTYVPFRNTHLLAAGVSWAEVLGADKVIIGAVAQDGSGYPDCRAEYYEAFNRLTRVGTREGRVEILTPLLHLSKVEIVRLGLELSAPFPLSWSCYQNTEQACGRCDSCRLRRRAFEQAGVRDPIPYAWDGQQEGT